VRARKRRPRALKAEVLRAEAVRKSG